MSNRFINVLHLSDFHHQADTAECEDVVVAALAKDLSYLAGTELAPDLCIFSGDLAYSGDDNAYRRFHSGVFEVVQRSTGLHKDRILLCPGNHDIQRDVVRLNADFVLGIRNAPDPLQEINDAYKSGKLLEHAEKSFVNYLDYQRSLQQSSVLHSDALMTVYHIEDLNLRAVAMNSALLSFGGMKGFERDEGRLLIPEAFFLNGQSSLGALQPDIVFTHHPPSAMHSSMASQFQGERLGHSHLFAYGHMHLPRPASVFEDDVSRIVNQSGALFYKSHRDTKYKGYSVVVMDRDARTYMVRHRTFYPDRLKFDLALTHFEGGTYYSGPGARRHFLKELPKFSRAELLDWAADSLAPDLEERLEGHIKRMNNQGEVVTPHFEIEGLVTSIKSDVVLPRHPDIESLDELFARPDSILIQGRSETGKSTALLIWAKARCENPGPYERVPVYMNWGDLPKGPRSFERLVKRSAPALPNGFTFEDLLQRGALELVIDDFVVTAPSVECLSAAITSYPNCRFIVAHKTKALSEFGFASFVPESVPFLSVRIRQLKRSQIRSIIQKRVALAKPEEDALVKDIMRELVQNNLPITPFTISSVMEIYNNEGALKFTNKANFLERLIELKLEKFAGAEIHVGAFDFKNKVRCLADVAEWMVRNDTYVLPENKLVELLNNHMEYHGFEIRVTDLLRQFYKAGILFEAGGKVRFGFMCFLEFFISARMLTDAEFRSKIVSPAEYLSFQNEIALYFAQSREDVDLLDEVAKRLDAIRDHIRAKEFFSENAGQVLDALPITRDGASVAELEHYEQTVRSPQLSDAERDDLLDGETPKDVGNRQEVYRPKLQQPESQWLYAVLLYSSMVRSCDFLPREAKERHLANAIDCWCEFLQFSLNIVPRLAEIGYVKIDEVEYRIPGLMELDLADRYRALQVIMPLGVGRMISYYMNTDKLRNQIRRPAGDEEAGFASLFRVSMLMDLAYTGIAGDMKNFFDKIQKKSTYAEYVLVKKAAEVYSQNRLAESDRHDFGEIVSAAIARLKAASRSELKTEKAKVLARLERNRLQIAAHDRGNS